MNRDLLGIIESAYADAPSSVEWQARLLDACRVMDEGLGVILSYGSFESKYSPHETTGTVDSGLLHAFLTTNDGLLAIATEPGQSWGRVIRSIAQSGGKTGSMVFGVDALSKHYSATLQPHGVLDCIGINGLVHESTNFGLYVPLATTRRHSARVSRRLALIGVHLAAARRRWTTPSVDEAWLTPNGKVIDAVGDAKNEIATLSLQAKAIEAVRTRKHRAEIDSPLSMWKGLVAGTWSLIERFESDGRRYWVAKRNAPDLGKRLRLSEGEQRVAKLSALGHSQKYVAYALGFSQSMVSVHLKSAMLKLRVRSRTEMLTLCDVLFERQPDTVS